MNTATTAILEKGTNCLVQHLGVIEAEAFISAVMREKFDYTEWQRNHFDGMSLDEINNAAVDYNKNLFENETLESLAAKASEFSKTLEKK